MITAKRTAYNIGYHFAQTVNYRPNIQSAACLTLEYTVFEHIPVIIRQAWIKGMRAGWLERVKYPNEVAN